jgi:hypothetical protein
MNLAFRPQGNSKRSNLYFSRKNGAGSVGKWNYHTRRVYGSFIMRVGGQLHYLGSHAPVNIRKKWRTVERKFYKRYHKVL